MTQISRRKNIMKNKEKSQKPTREIPEGEKCKVCGKWLFGLHCNRKVKKKNYAEGFKQGQLSRDNKVLDEVEKILKKDIPFFEMTAKEIYNDYLMRCGTFEDSQEVRALEFRRCVRDSQDRRLAGEYAKYLLERIKSLRGSEDKQQIQGGKK